jgi:cell filamentation protein
VPNYTCSDEPDAAVKNRLGAVTHEQPEEREPAFVFSRDAEIMDGHGPTGQFDAAHLKAIHRHLFQDVYEWAGRTRDEKVRLSYCGPQPPQGRSTAVAPKPGVWPRLSRNHPAGIVR